MPTVELLAVQPDRDLALIGAWLARPHVSRWWGDPAHARGVRLVGMAAAVANERAVGACTKAGLQPYRDFMERGETYRYFTKRLDQSLV
jgi:hypothetical protein